MRAILQLLNFIWPTHLVTIQGHLDNYLMDKKQQDRNSDKDYNAEMHFFYICTRVVHLFLKLFYYGHMLQALVVDISYYGIQP